MLLIAALFCTALAVIDSIGFWSGYGKDVWTISADDLIRLVQLFYAGELAYAMSTLFVKIAILALYLRLFPSQRFRRVAWASIAVVAGLILASIFGGTFQCVPIRYTWQQYQGRGEGRCINLWLAFMTHGVIIMVFDLWIIAMPMPILYRTQMSWSKKIQTGLVFAVGLVVTVISALRLHAVRDYRAIKSNPSWIMWPTTVWCALEAFIGVSVACLPAAKLLFQRIRQRVVERNTEKSQPVSLHNSQRPLNRPGVIHVRSTLFIASELRGEDSNLASLECTTSSTATCGSSRSMGGGRHPT